MYDYIIFTHIPAFYKVNLYNELSKKLKIHVVFISEGTKEKRSDDFLTLDKAKFSYQVLSKGNFQERNLYKCIYMIRKILLDNRCKKVLLNGWDLMEFWYIALFYKKEKNCLALESTIFESSSHGLKGLIKTFFLSYIERVYASGNLHVALLEKLKYKGDIRITKGVGIINKPAFMRRERNFEGKFLYVGRLTTVKNLEMLIEVFNELPNKKLTIVGDGEQKEILESIANKNITFFSSIKNCNISDIFLNHDVFILPSISEPWGLVIEEALYFGLPVFVSNRCGASIFVNDDINSVVFSADDKENLKDKIEFYDLHIKPENSCIISNKDVHQIECYYE